MTSRHRPVAMRTVVRGALILLILVTCTESVTKSACRKLMVRHTITDAKRGCKPKILVGCRGTCSSYTRVSPRDYGVIERSCECCQEVGYRTVKVRFDCPQRLPPYYFAEVRLPLDCKCRSCNTLSAGKIPEEVRLTDYMPD